MLSQMSVSWMPLNSFPQGAIVVSGYGDDGKVVIIDRLFGPRESAETLASAMGAHFVGYGK